MAIKCIIVDDELKARESLKKMLQTFCENVEVAALCENVEQAVEAPLLILQGANIQNVHHHQVTWLGTFYANRAAQVMHLQQLLTTFPLLRASTYT